LLGGDRALIASGGRLEVEVRIEPDLITACQQGISATVLAVRRI